MTHKKQYYQQEKYRTSIRLPRGYGQLRQDLARVSGCSDLAIRFNIHLLINMVLLGEE